MDVRLWASACCLLLYVLRFTDARTREYFIAIEEIEWDYAPTSLESIPPLYVERSARRIGRKYKKAVYRQYTDDTFKTPSYRHPSLGLYGPVIKGEIRDTIVVHGLNRASRKYSFHPHGVFYLKSSEGALYNDSTSSNSNDKADDGIPPGGRHTYIWEVRDEYGPGKDDPECLTWVYHSHVDPNRDINSGLIGTLLTCRPGTLTSRGHRTDVDREFAVIAMKIDENQGWYLDENIQIYTLEPHNVQKRDPDFIESNIMYALNGHIMFNLPGLVMCKGDLVSWHMIGMGEVFHNLAFLGQSVIVDQHRQSTVTLLPASFKTVLMRADNPGKWTMSCQVTTHTAGGMVADLVVSDGCSSSIGTETGMGDDHLDGIVRVYYISIEEVDWNYAPSGKNVLTTLPIAAKNQPSYQFFTKDNNRIGGVYRKTIYRGYEDESFTKRTSMEPHMGILGPLISGEVGDEIRVVLRNNGSKDYRIEPNGVFIHHRKKVVPGGTEIFIWTIPKSVSPTSKDENCLTYLYTSTVDVSDQESGLVGPLLVCKKGTLENELKKKTYYLLLSVFDENHSHFLQENIEKFALDPESVDKNDPSFILSNQMQSVNGMMFANLPLLDLCVGEDTTFRVFSVGSELDTHPFIMEGAITRYRTEYTGVVGVYPHSTATLNISPYSAGHGDYGCYLANHGSEGMVGSYKARECSIQPKFVPTGVKTYFIGIVEEIWDYLPERTDHKGDSVDDPGHYSYLEAKQEDGKFIGN